MDEKTYQEKLRLSLLGRLKEAQSIKDVTEREKKLANYKKYHGERFPDLFPEPEKAPEKLPEKELKNTEKLPEKSVKKDEKTLEKEPEKDDKIRGPEKLFSTTTKNELMARIDTLQEKFSSEDFKQDPRLKEREEFLRKKEEHKASLKSLIKKGAEKDAPSEFSLNELLKMKLPEPKFAVPGVLPEGLTLLAGKPKKGKSYLALTLALCISQGRTAFGKFLCPPGDVLYFSMEDKGNPGRLQRRSVRLLTKLLPTNENAASLDFRLDIETKEQFVDKASEWIAKSKNPKLIIIDTLARLMPDEYDNNDYKHAYRFMASLQAWATSNSIAVVVIHHTNKGRQADPIDEVMGSTGLSAAADSIWIYTKIKNHSALYIASRDLDSEKTFVVDYKKKGYINIEGELDNDEMDGERKRIISCIEKTPLSIQDISKALKKDYQQTKSLLYKMLKDEQVGQDRSGQYFKL